MSKLGKSIVSGTVLTAIAYVIIGLILIIWPEISMLTLDYIAAAIVAAVGVYYVIKYLRSGISEGRLNSYLSTGIILLLLAVVMVVRSDILISLLPVLLGLAIVLDGVVKLQRSVDLARLKFEGWIFVLILAAISIAIGMVLLFNQTDAAKSMTIILGIGLLFCGITGIVVNAFVSSKIKNFNKGGEIEVEANDGQPSADQAQEAEEAMVPPTVENDDEIEVTEDPYGTNGIPVEPAGGETGEETQTDTDADNAP